MSTDTEAYRELFLEESQIQLQEWERSLLSLEKAPADRELLDTLFRAIHTLKGSSGFVGCSELLGFLHDLESAVQPVRDGARPLSPVMIEALLEGLDAARALIDAYAHSRPLTVDSERVLSRLREPAAKKRLYRIALEVTAPPRERYMRSLLVQSRIEEAATIVTLNPSLEALRLQDGEFRYEMVVETEGRREELARVVDVDQVVVHRLDEMPEIGAPRAEGPAAHQEAAAAEPHSESATAMSVGTLRKESVIRVPVGKLDALMNLVGELVVQNSGFISLAGELAGSYGRSRLVSLLSERTEMLSRVARQLQDSVMKVRMLPVATVFDRFTRVVRDLARSLNKQVAMQTYGDETEIDKKVIDRIGDPLVHLIRNAVDHGLESAEDRRAAGKDPIGRVTLGAYQEANHICIEISDDGRGLDRDKIVATAVRKGLMSAADAEKMSFSEALQLVFLPGFSTAERVTDVSGRGVGMDVVKRTVEELDGTVSLASTPGAGTKITITLPLTMAIIRAIMVQEDGVLFAIPLSSVSEIVKMDDASYETLGEENVIHLRDAFVPVVSLRDLLGWGAAAEGNGNGKSATKSDTTYRNGPVVIVTYEDKKIGVAAERLVGNSEIVIKSLARNYREIDGLVGASILGNGKIALILDMKGLMDIHLHKRATPSGTWADAARAAALKDAPPVHAPRVAAPLPAAPAAAAPATPAPARVGPAPVPATPAPAAAAPTPAPARVAPAPAPIDAKLKGQMEDIYNASAIEASQAMTRLMGRSIQVSFPDTSEAPIGDISEMLGGEEAAVARIYVGIQGDIKGGCLFVMAYEEAFRLCDILLQREAGTTRALGDEENSALSETGNILCSSFINAVADGSGLTALSEVPDLCVDMCQAAIDPVLARFNQSGMTLLVTRTELFVDESERSVSNMLLFLDQGSYPALSAAFAARDREPQGRR